MADFELTDAERAALELERELTGEYSADITRAVARAKVALNRLLMRVPEDSRKQVADHWYDLIESAAKTHAGDPQAFVRALEPEEFIRVVTSRAASVTSGSETASDVPADLTDDETARRMSAVLDALANLASKFGYADGFAFLSTGPVSSLSQIADRGGDNPRAVTELLRLVLSATNPTNPYALQADGSLMVNDMYDRAERARADLARTWKPFIDALNGLATDVIRDRRAGMLELAQGHVHPDIAAKDRVIAGKDTEIGRLNDEVRDLTAIIARMRAALQDVDAHVEEHELDAGLFGHGTREDVIPLSKLKDETKNAIRATRSAP